MTTKSALRVRPLKPEGFVQFNGKMYRVVAANPTVREHIKSAKKKVKAAGGKVKQVAVSTYQKATAGTWFEKHGKTVITGTAVVAGVVMAGAVVYYLINYFNEIANPGGGTGSSTTPYCESLYSELSSLYTQIGNYNVTAYKNGGTYSPAASAAIASLQSQIADVSTLITNNCSSPTVPTPGQTTDNFLASASYSLLTALEVVLGIAVTYVAVRLFLRARVAYSKSKGQGELPDSLEDTVAVTGFNPATAGQIMAQAQGIADAAEGTESASDVADVLRTLTSTDPAAAQAVADDLSTYFAGLADAATDTDVAACFQQLSDDFAATAAGDDEALDDAIGILDTL